jgi:DNA-binding transcriptional LysR family regulator
MGLMDWDKLRVFHAVAEAGSFTHAGDTLNLSQSAVSRQISALEQSLRVPLFHRHARGLILTEQGEMLYRTAHDIFGKLAVAEAVLRDSKDRPRGELKITTTVGFGSTWLTPRMQELLDMYPELTVNLVLSDRLLDLSMREADVAIRFSEPTQPDLIQRKLLTVHHHIFASPDYLKKYGTPQKASDLKTHRLIAYGEAPPLPIADINWMMDLVGSETVRPVLRVNNVYGLLLAVESGLGITALPDYIVQGQSKLVQILPDIETPEFDAYFIYPEELRHSKRISVFRDFLVRKVADWRF